MSGTKKDDHTNRPVSSDGSNDDDHAREPKRSLPNSSDSKSSQSEDEKIKASDHEEMNQSVNEKLKGSAKEKMEQTIAEKVAVARRIWDYMSDERNKDFANKINQRAKHFFKKEKFVVRHDRKKYRVGRSKVIVDVTIAGNVKPNQAPETENFESDSNNDESDSTSSDSDSHPRARTDTRKSERTKKRKRSVSYNENNFEIPDEEERETVSKNSSSHKRKKSIIKNTCRLSSSVSVETTVIEYEYDTPKLSVSSAVESNKKCDRDIAPRRTTDFSYADFVTNARSKQLSSNNKPGNCMKSKNELLAASSKLRTKFLLATDGIDHSTPRGRSEDKDNEERIENDQMSDVLDLDISGFPSDTSHQSTPKSTQNDQQTTMLALQEPLESMQEPLESMQDPPQSMQVNKI
ncbi:peptidyl-prolyl cis-trans isomerase G-like [Ctenocephalides felis]|uniref:peptidyl-prolyl cis-trans isomerase G-like n=1 Tax=Ctenocephalides felis TaxID=7515 RepID=UPI000E6E1936|nr:peptidyl-prolyl cis-trans isomerase G-like [Ctenocephalides felis]